MAGNARASGDLPIEHQLHRKARGNERIATTIAPARMAASKPVAPAGRRRRPRRGSLERPVSARMYRAAWVLITLPLVLAAFTVGRPEALSRPALPPSFDAHTAKQLTEELAHSTPDRVPGTPGAAAAADWVVDQLGAYNLTVQRQSFDVDVAGLGRRTLTNVIARPLEAGPSRSPESIVVLASRDTLGASPGLDHNASGTGALIELARNLSTLTLSHTIIFVSTDGGSYGGLGAAYLAQDPSFRANVLAVINLDSLVGDGAPRLEFAGDGSRSPAGVLLATADASVADQAGRPPTYANAFEQLLDLAFPFSLYDQGPVLGSGVSALTLTAAGTRPPANADTAIDQSGEETLGVLGRSAQALITSLDGAAEVARGADSFLYLGGRYVRGFAIEFLLFVACLPVMIATVDLIVRLRRRGALFGPALRSFRSRLFVWLWAGAMAWLFTALGAFPNGAPRPLSPDSEAAQTWPFAALLGLALLAAAGWFIARVRLVPRGSVDRLDELAGHAVAMLALCVITLVLAATNGFSLLLLLPSLHAWLWAPHVQDRNLGVRLSIFLVGLAGPALLVSSFAFRLDLGLDAFWYVGTLFTVGYAPASLFIAFLGWAAAAGQVSAILFRRYAPYPPGEMRGPFREGVRWIVLRRRARQRGAASEPAPGWPPGESEPGQAS